MKAWHFDLQRRILRMGYTLHTVHLYVLCIFQAGVAQASSGLNPHCISQSVNFLAIFLCPDTVGCWLLASLLAEMNVDKQVVTHSGKTSSQVTHPVVFTRKTCSSPT